MLYSGFGKNDQSQITPNAANTSLINDFPIRTSDDRPIEDT